MRAVKDVLVEMYLELWKNEKFHLPLGEKIKALLFIYFRSVYIFIHIRQIHALFLGKRQINMTVYVVS